MPEVTLDSTGDAGSFFAQGLHVGIFDLAPGGEKLIQLSNGLQVFPTMVTKMMAIGGDLLARFANDVVLLSDDILSSVWSINS